MWSRYFQNSARSEKKTRLKVNSVLDREPILFISNYVKFFKFFKPFQIYPNPLIFSKAIKKIQYSQNEFILNSVEKYKSCKINTILTLSKNMLSAVNSFLQKPINKSIHSRIIKNKRSILHNLFKS